MSSRHSSGRARARYRGKGGTKEWASTRHSAQVITYLLGRCGGRGNNRGWSARGRRASGGRGGAPSDPNHGRRRVVGTAGRCHWRRAVFMVVEATAQVAARASHATSAPPTGEASWCRSWEQPRRCSSPRRRPRVHLHRGVAAGIGVGDGGEDARDRTAGSSTPIDQANGIKQVCALSAGPIDQSPPPVFLRSYKSTSNNVEP